MGNHPRPLGNGGMNGADNQRKSMMQAVEASLKRMELDYIDLLRLHAWDQCYTGRRNDAIV